MGYPAGVAAVFILADKQVDDTHGKDTFRSIRHKTLSRRWKI